MSVTTTATAGVVAATIAASDHRERILAATNRGSVYSIAPGQTKWKKIRTMDEPVVCLGVIPTGGMYAVATETTVEIFSTDRGGIRFAKFQPQATTTHLAFSRDGHLLAVLMDNDQIELRLAMTGQNLAVLSPKKVPLSIGFDPNNRLMGYCISQGGLQPIDIQSKLGLG